MSTIPNAFPILDVRLVAPKAKSAPEKAFLQPVIEMMTRVRSELGTAAFAFTAPNRHAGTSFIVNLVAEELPRQFDCTVAILPTAALKDGDPRRLPQGFIAHAPNIWTAVPDKDLGQMPDFALQSVWINSNPENFDFILIDLPALNASSQALRWAKAGNGVLLVVEAGVTQINQIEEAQRQLRSAGGRLAGMILNRRTYPVPRFLYRFL